MFVPDADSDHLTVIGATFRHSVQNDMCKCSSFHAAGYDALFQLHELQPSVARLRLIPVSSTLPERQRDIRATSVHASLGAAAKRGRTIGIVSDSM